MLIWENVLIMKCVYICLRGHHPLDVANTLYEIQLWIIFQVTAKKQLNILRNFYVDDMLKLVPLVRDALTLIQEVTGLCQRGGLKLIKLISNKKDVLSRITDTLRRNGVEDKDFADSFPNERGLEIIWDAENDSIKFKINLKDEPMTRRGMLLAISSINDYLVSAYSFVLQGRRLLQGLCQVIKGCQKGKRWESILKGLEKICIRICIKPVDVVIIKEASLHYFSYASEESYGQSTYLQLVNASG